MSFIHKYYYTQIEVRVKSSLRPIVVFAHAKPCTNKMILTDKFPKRIHYLPQTEYTLLEGLHKNDKCYFLYYKKIQKCIFAVKSNKYLVDLQGIGQLSALISLLINFQI